MMNNRSNYSNINQQLHGQNDQTLKWCFAKEARLEAHLKAGMTSDVYMNNFVATKTFERDARNIGEKA